MDALILISIGPVQDFIASARRSRDLWFGSWLLSELSKAAAYAIYKHNGTLIFPAPQELEEDLQPGSDFNVTNKILARVPVATTQNLVKDVEQAVKCRLDRIYKDTFTRIKGKLDTCDIAKAQVDDMLEIFWATVPISSDSKAYATARQEVEALMVARKTTRDFRPVTWSSNKPKSSLDGQRESVIPETSYPKRDDSKSERERKIQDLHRQYGAGQAERLSGVDLLKRHGSQGDEAHFMSTSHVAALPLIARLAGVDGIADHWKRYLDCLQESALRKELIDSEKIARRYIKNPSIHSTLQGYDGSLLFEERLNDILEGTPTDDIAQVKGALREFLDALLGHVIHPLPYYALLLADGDNMGKVIDAMDSLEKHQELSMALSAFARKVKAIVEGKRAGALLYAGGDDVLALLPLHTVLACAKELANTFRDTMGHFEAQISENGQQQVVRPSLSVGVAVSHHIEPLSDALDLARQAEKRAKAISGKDALAIAVSKRSGADRVVADKWGALDTRLHEFIQLHRSNTLPDNAAYNLVDIAERLEIPGDDITKLALRFEAKRIIKRKRGQSGHEKLPEETIQRLHTLIDTIPSIRQLADELIVAREFARARDLAEGKQERNTINATVDH
ncbi:MAG: type III-B CRISPR-associated protein Cas10/Cmr2 [Chloroflexaceae bacterium]|nr:type III-B CRISPR-associated protein Cas10/Cmr2 [Chloroflexaceae bacterium]